MKKLGSIIQKISDVFSVVCIVGVTILMLLNVADVIFNKITGANITGSYEISQHILMCTVFATFAYAQTHKTHIHVTLLIDRLPGRTKFIPFFLTNVLACVTAIYCTYATFYRAQIQLANNAVSDILHYPLYPFYYVEGICMVAFVIALLYDTFLSFRAIFSDEYAELVHANW